MDPIPQGGPPHTRIGRDERPVYRESLSAQIDLIRRQKVADIAVDVQHSRVHRWFNNTWREVMGVPSVRYDA